jgi:hypothetical protein
MARSLLIDTNLLVVLVVGLTDEIQVGSHKRTKAYTREDFLLIREMLDNYQELWITAQTVAECSNLLRQTNDNFSANLMETLSNIVSHANESNMTSTVIFSEPCTLRLGITDGGIAKKSKRVTALLTADLDLYLEVDKASGNAINFNHIRAGAWKSASAKA